MKKIIVLISGGGSNLAALIQALKQQDIAQAEIIKVIADRDCAGKQHAFNANIPFAMIDRKLGAERFAQALNAAIADEADLIVLAGFLSIVPPSLIARFPRKIINLHPSLLPKFGGAGMYGMKVHQAVIEAGESESGCSVHYVDSGIDTGEIIAQAKVPVLPQDSAADLQQRIAPVEHQLLVKTVAELLSGNKS